jgi:hypothetical protein
MNKNTHTLALTIFSPVSANVKFVSRMYKNTFISIMEQRIPIHDYVDLNDNKKSVYVSSCRKEWGEDIPEGPPRM